jgi:hypothetical protein
MDTALDGAVVGQRPTAEAVSARLIYFFVPGITISSTESRTASTIAATATIVRTHRAQT